MKCFILETPVLVWFLLMAVIFGPHDLRGAESWEQLLPVIN